MTTYAHNLGVAPTRIDLFTLQAGSTVKSRGYYSESGQQCIYAGGTSNDGALVGSVIRMWQASNQGQTGVITDVTDTDIEITWTENGSPSSDLFYCLMVLIP